MQQQLADVAQRLRQVREAHQRFLALYAVEVALVEPGVERVAAELSADDEDEASNDLPDWFPPAGPATDTPDGDGPAALGW